MPSSSPEPAHALASLAAAAEVYRVGRKLALIDHPGRVVAALPRLALEVIAADAAGVVGLGDRPRAEAWFGSPLSLDAPWLADSLRDALESGRATAAHDDAARHAHRPEKARALLVPLRLGNTRSALIVAQTVPGRELRVTDLESLGVVAVLGSLAWARAEASEGAAKSRGALEAVAEAVSEGLIQLDADGRVLDLNPAAARWLGVDPQDHVGKLATEAEALRLVRDALARRSSSDATTLTVRGTALRVRDLSHRRGAVWVLSEAAPAARSESGFRARYTFADIITSDRGVENVLADARRAAGLDVPVLVTGESGTGKELLAQAIHGASRRAEGPFVAVNVAALPADLLESELFGYAPGAFTGASPKGKPGSFELANGGTLLLDEIGEMSPVMQAKLLRVLQERELVRVGDTRPRPVDARVISATNLDLDAQVRAGRFRLDLYHRLRVVQLHLAPLRRRPADIPLLVRHFLDQACERLGRRPVRLEPWVMDQLIGHPWPGNLRELSNLLLGVVSLLPLDVDRIEELPIFPTHPDLTPIFAPSREAAPSTPDPASRASSLPPTPVAGIRTLEEVEREAVVAALAAFAGNLSQTAKALGISRTTLYTKIQRYGLETP